MAVILKTVLVYLFVLLLLRMTTRRIMRSATAADMVLVFVFGGFAIQVALGDEHSAIAPLLALSTISLLHLSLFWLKARAPLVGKFTEGTPSVVFANGRWEDRRMRQLRVEERDITAELRQKGMRRMDEVDAVVMEHNGGISVIPKEKEG